MSQTLTNIAQSNINNNNNINNSNNINTNNNTNKKVQKPPTQDVNGKPGDKKIKELLIEALTRHPYGLTVSQLYTYVVENSGNFTTKDLTWQGNVRHLLSKKAYFYKTDVKEATQRGRYWRFNPDSYERSKQKITKDGNSSPPVIYPPFPASTHPQQLTPLSSPHYTDTPLPANTQSYYPHYSPDHHATYFSPVGSDRARPYDKYQHPYPHKSRFVDTQKTTNAAWNKTSDHYPNKENHSSHQAPYPEPIYNTHEVPFLCPQTSNLFMANNKQVINFNIIPSFHPSVYTPPQHNFNNNYNNYVPSFQNQLPQLPSTNQTQINQSSNNNFAYMHNNNGIQPSGFKNDNLLANTNYSLKNNQVYAHLNNNTENSVNNNFSNNPNNIRDSTTQSSVPNTISTNTNNNNNTSNNTENNENCNNPINTFQSMFNSLFSDSIFNDIAPNSYPNIQCALSNNNPQAIQPSSFPSSTIQPLSIQPPSIQPSSNQPSSIQPSSISPSSLDPNLLFHSSSKSNFGQFYQYLS